MKSLPDRLNDQIERQRRGERSPLPLSKENRDPETEELAQLARRLQFTPQLRPDPRFVQSLEARVLAHHATQIRQRAVVQPRKLFQPLRLLLTVGIALACVLLVITAGTFTVAAQVSNPSNPLYGINRWVQQMQHPGSNAAVMQAHANWQHANTQVNMLTSHVDPATYQQSLTDMDQQIKQLDQSIQALPSGSDKDDLAQKLTALKAHARQTLRNLLPRLTLSEKLQTTNELGRLDDDTIPRIESAILVVAHPQHQATITMSGDHLQSGAQLLVDQQIVTASSPAQNHGDSAVFIVNWPDQQSPKTIGILNPDGTVAQTTTITFSGTEGNSTTNKGNSGNNGNTDKGNNGNNGSTNGNKGGNSNQNDKGNNGNNNNGNENGKGKGKGAATPTPTP